jgi:hypothetical protein
LICILNLNYFNFNYHFILEILPIIFLKDCLVFSIKKKLISKIVLKKKKMKIILIILISYLILKIKSQYYRQLYCYDSECKSVLFDIAYKTGCNIFGNEYYKYSCGKDSVDYVTFSDSSCLNEKLRNSYNFSDTIKSPFMYIKHICLNYSMDYPIKPFFVKVVYHPNCSDETVVVGKYLYQLCYKYPFIDTYYMRIDTTGNNYTLLYCSDSVCSLNCNVSFNIGFSSCISSSGYAYKYLNYNFQCYSKNVGDSTVCNGHGKCVGQDKCVCDNGYNLPKCELPLPASGNFFFVSYLIFVLIFVLNFLNK